MLQVKNQVSPRFEVSSIMKAFDGGPIVKEVNPSNSGCGWLHAIISIEKQTEGDGKSALMATFAAHPSLKHAIVVDTDIDVFNLEEVE